MESYLTLLQLGDVRSQIVLDPIDGSRQGDPADQKREEYDIREYGGEPDDLRNA